MLSCGQINCCFSETSHVGCWSPEAPKGPNIWNTDVALEEVQKVLDLEYTDESILKWRFAHQSLILSRMSVCLLPLWARDAELAKSAFVSRVETRDVLHLWLSRWIKTLSIGYLLLPLPSWATGSESGRICCCPQKRLRALSVDISPSLARDSELGVTVSVSPSQGQSWPNG